MTHSDFCIKNVNTVLMHHSVLILRNSTLAHTVIVSLNTLADLCKQAKV